MIISFHSPLSRALCSHFFPASKSGGKTRIKTKSVLSKMFLNKDVFVYPHKSLHPKRSVRIPSFHFQGNLLIPKFSAFVPP